MTVDEQVQAALGQQQAGKSSAAETAYREILREHPQQADALALLATIVLSRGDFDQAIDLLRRATISRPEFADAHKNLGTLLARKGRSREALAAYQRAIDLQPRDARSHFELGNLHVAAGEVDLAIEAYARAVELQPHFYEAHRNLSVALNRRDRNEEAALSARRAAFLQPEALRRFSEINKRIFEENAAGTEAMANYLKAIDYQPKAKSGNGRTASPRSREESIAAYQPADASLAQGVDVHANAAMVLAESRRFDEAKAACEIALLLAPDSVLTHEAQGKIALHSENARAAVNHFQRAIEVDPNKISAFNSLGLCLRSLGRFDEAAECFRKVASIDPAASLALANLVTIRKVGAKGPEIEKLLEILEDRTLPDFKRARTEFSVATALDAAEQYDDAFAHLLIANQLMKKVRAESRDVYDPAEMTQFTRLTIERFKRSFFDERRNWGVDSELPVFVVGMPRSGTTLVQQVAASHPLVHGAGELGDICHIAKELGLENFVDEAFRCKPEAVEPAARAHVRHLQSMNPSATRVVDKAPGNIIRRALIQMLFPRARVIFCRRDPRDTCLSCFFQNFGDGCTFSFDLEHCAHAQIENDKLADHWLKVLPERSLEIHYEEMVADLEGQSRRLIDFLGLEWDSRCLEFHRSETAVYTASVWQVRQPLYASSVGRWRNYEKHLAPLLRALQPQNRPDKE